MTRSNAVIGDKLDDLLKRNCTILVGEANGADRAVRQHPATRGYQNVMALPHDRSGAYQCTGQEGNGTEDRGLLGDPAL